MTQPAASHSQRSGRKRLGKQSLRQRWWAHWALALWTCTAPANAGEATPFRMHDTLETATGVDGIRLLGALDLSDLATPDNNFAELSGLAWDADANLLHAVSDRGMLFALRPSFTDGHLTDAKLVSAVRLTDVKRKRLRGKSSDAEGLVALHADNGVEGDTVLAVAFERIPRVALHKPDGTFMRNAGLASPLQSARAYRSANKGPEAVMLTAHHGLVVGSEWPLKSYPDDQHKLFAADGANATMARLDETNSGLVALEALSDGSFLAVERAHNWLTLSLVVTISRVGPWSSAHSSSTPLKKSTVARIDSSLGWYVDNFEGLAHHQGNRFFLVSDDNGSALQKTLLLYFELL